ncbi:MAG: argininosuccinate lyase [Candidatus Bathyarchaeales archaeon]
MSVLFKNGRIKSSRKDVTRFISSIKDDEKILKYVIEINEAHTIMLMEQKIIGKEQGAEILNALEKLKAKAKIKPWLEDIHLYIEEEVAKKARGEAGENLHVAKSRNDQVATAIRMKLREELINLMKVMLNFQKNLLKKAEEHTETIMPGYTHLRAAQPVTFAHYLLYQFDVFQRNFQRLIECYGRVNACPMGAAALATTSFPVSRERIAELLGFAEVLENSMDAVGSRDFVLETLAVLSIIAIDVSRLAEDLIVWSTPEFDLVELPDEFCSTSSIMPQKKNPDVLEVVRARMSHVIGNFTACALTLKSLPSGYNLDFQEVTPKLWESLEKVNESLKILSDLIISCEPKGQNAKSPILAFSTSTELVRILFQKYGVPFRTAHRIVGAFVRKLNEKGLDLADATSEMLKETAKEVAGISLTVSASDLKTTADVVSFVKAHNVRGGPSPAEVQRMLGSRKSLLASMNVQVAEIEAKIADAHEKLGGLAGELRSPKQPKDLKIVR